MPRAWTIIKREFTEMVRTKAYIIGTVLGPFLIALLFVLPLAFMRAGGGQRSVLILDATGDAVGTELQAILEAMDPDDMDGMGSRFSVQVREVSGEATAEKREARQQVAMESEDALDGFLYVPPGIVDGGTATYEGKNATSVIQMEQVRQGLNAAVRGRRLQREGVAPTVLARVMSPVAMEARRPGSEEEEGEGAETAFILGFLMAMAVYMPVIMFAAGVMRGVLEEKRDRIVEVLLSSIQARQFIVGKVLGIGGASLLQMLVWVGFAAAALTFGPGIAGNYGLNLTAPEVPGRVAIVFLFFFLSGFMLYAAMFGAAGAIATSEQEAQQMQIPVTIPLMLGIFMMYALLNDPDSGLAVAGSIIPFTAPVVMPMRAMMTDIPTTQYLLAAVLMIATVVGMMWAAAKIYHIGVLSTGKRPTMRELMRWLRTA